MKKNIRKDQVLTYDDVEVPDGRVCDKLRAEQDAFFADDNLRFKTLFG